MTPEEKDHARAAELAETHKRTAYDRLIEHEQRAGADRRSLVVCIVEHGAELEIEVQPRARVLQRLLEHGYTQVRCERVEPPAFKMLVVVGACVQTYDVDVTHNERRDHG